MDWFDDLQRGNSEAANALWERYFPRLVEIARSKLWPVASAAADAEDIALGAMDSFFAAAQKGRFPNLVDRHGLWRLLLWMTACEVNDLKRRETRKRRGEGRVRNASDLPGASPRSEEFDLGQVLGDEPTPESAVMMREECHQLLGLLDDPQLAAVAIAKMEGYRNREIADQRGVSERTIERELMTIRTIWTRKRRDER